MRAAFRCLILFTLTFVIERLLRIQLHLPRFRSNTHHRSTTCSDHLTEVFGLLFRLSSQIEMANTESCEEAAPFEKKLIASSGEQGSALLDSGWAGQPRFQREARPRRSDRSSVLGSARRIETRRPSASQGCGSDSCPGGGGEVRDPRGWRDVQEESPRWSTDYGLNVRAPSWRYLRR